MNVPAPAGLDSHWYVNARPVVKPVSERLSITFEQIVVGATIPPAVGAPEQGIPGPILMT